MRIFAHLTFAAGLAVADSAEMWEFPDARTVMPVNSDGVRMVAETVLVAPLEKPSPVNWWYPPLMEVHCVFILQNLSDKPVEITVGFPFEKEFGDFYRTVEDEEILEMVKENWKPGDTVSVPEGFGFTAEVDGKGVPVQFKKGAPNPRDKLLYWPIIATWKMSFGPGQKKRLVNTYTTGWDGIGGFDGIKDSIKYITRSGALWAGSIGEAIISITVPDEMFSPCFSDTLCAVWNFSVVPETDGRTFTWVYRDWEPDEDISLSVSYYRPVDALVELYVCGEPDNLVSRLDWRKDALYPGFLDILCENYMPLAPPGLSLRILRNLPFAAEGHGFNDPALSQIFPSGDRKLSLDDLSPQDRKKVEVVKSLEEELARARAVSDSLGYTAFLPLFALRRRWDKKDLALYQKDPELQQKYLFLLENLEAAVAGTKFKDPGLDAFFRLTGWYVPGKVSAYGKLIKPIPAKEVIQYRKGL